MNTTAIIQARMGSSRLPGKVLLALEDHKPLLEYLIDRLKGSQKLDHLIVATSADPSDHAVADYCRSKNIECFRGDLQNVARRFFDLIRHYRLPSFVRISGDSPWLDSRLIDAGIGIFETGQYDIVTNIWHKTFPKGQSFEIFRAETYCESYSQMRESADLEHVTPFFYRNAGKFKIYNVETSDRDYSDINLCIDTEEDWLLFKQVTQRLSGSFLEYDWKTIVRLYCENRQGVMAAR
ncbi:MAG: hypothetical protein HY391_02860 [Deltaproteobacteria bacterium]|nr:hypothetical protein [Deltaproteobacteria bacterium]